MTPTLVVLTLTTVTLKPWILPKIVWKRQLIRLGGALLLIYFIATFPLTIALANIRTSCIRTRRSGCEHRRDRDFRSGRDIKTY